MEFLLALVGGIFIFAIFAAIVWSFIFDAIVLLVSSIALHIDNKKAFFWNHIWMVWIMTGAASFCSMLILNFMTLGLLSTAIKILISGGLSFLSICRLKTPTSASGKWGCHKAKRRNLIYYTKV